jgi:hypothetical protein
MQNRIFVPLCLGYTFIFFRIYFLYCLGSIFYQCRYGLFLFDNVIHVLLLAWLCILIVCLCITTLTEVFPCFFLTCKANARVKPAKMGHGPHSYFLCCSMYCLCYCMYFCVVLCIVCFVTFSLLFVCVYVCWTTATGWLPNCSKIYIISYHTVSHLDHKLCFVIILKQRYMVISMRRSPRKVCYTIF